MSIHNVRKSVEKTCKIFLLFVDTRKNGASHQLSTLWNIFTTHVKVFFSGEGKLEKIRERRGDYVPCTCIKAVQWAEQNDPGWIISYHSENRIRLKFVPRFCVVSFIYVFSKTSWTEIFSVFIWIAMSWVQRSKRMRSQFTNTLVVILYTMYLCMD